LADGVVFLVRWRKTPSKAASVALRRLYDVHAEMLGAVLTLVDVGEQERAGYADGGTFLKAYRPYYETGRASGRESGGQFESIEVGGVALKKKNREKKEIE